MPQKVTIPTTPVTSMTVAELHAILDQAIKGNGGGRPVSIYVENEDEGTRGLLHGPKRIFQWEDTGTEVVLSVGVRCPSCGTQQPQADRGA